MANNPDTPIDRTTDVTVKVPAHRLGEFYEMYGRWLRLGRPNAAAAIEAPAEGRYPVAWDPRTDLELATAAWAKFPKRAKALFGTLIDHPGREYTGAELAELHDVPNGRSGVAGVLAHPGRQLKKIGRKHHFTYSDRDGVGRYSMTPDLAALFERARNGTAR